MKKILCHRHFKLTMLLNPIYIANLVLLLPVTLVGGIGDGSDVIK